MTTPSPSASDGVSSTRHLSTASAPFDKTFADIILRTSDNVDFYVWKGILIEVSPVFADMFLLGDKREPAKPRIDDEQPTTGRIAAIPVLESSAVLDPLLRMCYPPPHADFTSIDVLKPVIAAAHKYQMEGVMEVLKELLLHHAQKAPLRVYVIAVRFDMHESVGIAARHFLAQHLPDEYVPQLEEFNAGSYHRLLAYRKKCTQTLADMIASKLSWLQDRAWHPLLTCTCAAEAFTLTLRNSNVNRAPRVWFWQHHQRMGALLAERPCRTTIKDPKLTDRAVREASGCANCRTLVHEGLHAFTAELKDEVDRRLEEERSLDATLFHYRIYLMINP